MAMQCSFTDWQPLTHGWSAQRLLRLLGWTSALLALRVGSHWLDLLPGVFVFQPWLVVWWYAVTHRGPAAFLGGLLGTIAGEALFAPSVTLALFHGVALCASALVAWKLQLHRLLGTVAAALTHAAWFGLLADTAGWFPCSDTLLILLIHHAVSFVLLTGPIHHILNPDPIPPHVAWRTIFPLVGALLAVAAGLFIGRYLYGIPLSTVPALGVHSGVWTSGIMLPLLLVQAASLFLHKRTSAPGSSPTKRPLSWQSLMD